MGLLAVKFLMLSNLSLFYLICNKSIYKCEWIKVEMVTDIQIAGQFKCLLTSPYFGTLKQEIKSISNSKDMFITSSKFVM